MPEAAKSIIVICEAPADRRTACELADRVLCQTIDWFSPELLKAFRCWRGLRSSDEFLAWKDIPRLVQVANVRIHGHFDNGPGALEAKMARNALALVMKEAEQSIDGVVLLRDSDNKWDRNQGFRQARSETSLKVPVVIGVAHAKRECWVLAGFRAQDETEKQRLDVLKHKLGFDPTQRAHELTATEKGAKRNAKEVLEILVGGSFVREAGCWAETELDILAARGKGSGLADFLVEVRERLVPLWSGWKP